MRTLKCLLLVICLALLRPFFVSSDVVFTDGEYKELQQVIQGLETLNNNNQILVENLQKDLSSSQILVKNLQEMNSQLQNSYRRQKTYLIMGSILIIISSGIVGYGIGAFNGY